MKYMQKLGKALMLPVACMPICGILIGIGYMLCPNAMQGGDIAGTSATIGMLLVKAGSALIDNIAILFAVGVGVGMSDEKDGVGGLAALVSWLIMTTLLNADTVSVLMPSAIEDPAHLLAFQKIANPFVGILAGVIGASCFNRFKSTKLPDWLAFFSGKRCVAVIAGVVSIVVSAILMFIWPVLFGGLVALGNAIAGLDAVGAGVYAFLNRLLIPFGLHHALNNVFWFDTIGLGDLTHFWAGEASADVSWSLGMYMSGFFPCMMFGIPGAALAIYKCAKPEKRKIVAGIMLSCALCSFVCGVTEPFEFSFMFLAPVLYFIYALMYGLFTFVVVLLDFRAGFCFSAGATDLLFSARLPAANNTLMIIPLGIAAFVLFYLVFRIMITKLDLKTPGREDDAKGEETAVMGKRDFVSVAEVVLKGVGGKGNVVSVDNCVTRLRLEVKDSSLIDKKLILSAGVHGVIIPGRTSVQIVVGPKVQFVADEFSRLCKVEQTRSVKHSDIIFNSGDSGISGDEFNFVINDELGIHARPAGGIAQIARKYECDIQITAGNKKADAKSIIELMSLGAAKGTELAICANGNRAHEALAELCDFMERSL